MLTRPVRVAAVSSNSDRDSTQPIGEIECHERLGGLLCYYHHRAA